MCSANQEVRISEEFAHEMGKSLKNFMARERAYKSSGAFAKGQWRLAAVEALRGGCAFTELASRKRAVAWDGRMGAWAERMDAAIKAGA
jgi:hypothetical protein